MCGRYSQTLTVGQIEEAFGPITIPAPPKPNYNLAPTQLAPVITNRDPQQLSLFEWGLVPFWSKDGKNTARMINARAETILTKPAFRKPVRERRCLVLADSFYEWQKAGKSKQAYRILSATDEVLVFAGIWEYWRDKADPENEKRSFSILTTAPNAEMKPIHDRMPVVLAKAEQEAWLGTLTDADITALTQTPPDGTLELYPVNPAVGNVRNNGSSLHERSAPGLFDL